MRYSSPVWQYALFKLILLRLVTFAKEVLGLGVKKRVFHNYPTPARKRTRIPSGALPGGSPLNSIPEQSEAAVDYAAAVKSCENDRSHVQLPPRTGSLSSSKTHPNCHYTLASQLRARGVGPRSRLFSPAYASSTGLLARTKADSGTTAYPRSGLKSSCVPQQKWSFDGRHTNGKYQAFYASEADIKSESGQGPAPSTSLSPFLSSWARPRWIFGAHLLKHQEASQGSGGTVSVSTPATSSSDASAATAASSSSQPPVAEEEVQSEGFQKTSSTARLRLRLPLRLDASSSHDPAEQHDYLTGSFSYNHDSATGPVAPLFLQPSHSCPTLRGGALDESPLLSPEDYEYAVYAQSAQSEYDEGSDVDELQAAPGNVHTSTALFDRSATESHSCVSLHSHLCSVEATMLSRVFPGEPYGHDCEEQAEQDPSQDMMKIESLPLQQQQHCAPYYFVQRDQKDAPRGRDLMPTEAARDADSVSCSETDNASTQCDDDQDASWGSTTSMSNAAASDFLHRTLSQDSTASTTSASSKSTHRNFKLDQRNQHRQQGLVYSRVRDLETRIDQHRSRYSPLYPNCDHTAAVPFA
ncbi:unnamed protein product [Amoebophrya sp. A120]|nr:unnamed protein product [Amoebophrya sp. A120]|eukprot:GSA120T00011607001.1